MTDLRWSKADTHCPFCDLPKAREAEEERDHDEDAHDDSCWCVSYCWDACNPFDAEREFVSLRATVEAQAEVIQRYKAGWVPSMVVRSDWHYRPWGASPNCDNEPMSPADQIVLYGEVVAPREEE